MSLEGETHVIDWLPSFVLDALTAEEMHQVSQHLALCPTCQVELARYQQVVDELPLAVAQTTPPPELKRKIMQSIHSQQPASQVQPPSSAAQPTVRQKLASLFPRHLPAYGLALIIILVLGNLIVWRQLNLTTQKSSTPLRVVILANTKYSPGAEGTMVMNPNSQDFALVVDNLASLQPEQQYQIWLIKGAQHISAGVFSVDPNGYASLHIQAPMSLEQFDAIGVSVEPAGGSPQPTGPNVFHAYLLQ